MNTKNQRYDYVDILRCLSAFLVVQIHVSSSKWNLVGFNNSSFAALTCYNGLSRSAVPIFVMISGMLMLSKEVSIKHLMKKIFKVMVCFYAWSIIYSFQDVLIDFIKTGDVLQYDFDNAVQRIWGGHYHQWFLPMIAGLYLTVPLLKKICADKKTMQYFICFWLFNSIILQFLPNEIKISASKMNLYFPVGYIGYFVIGYYLSQYQIEKKYRICIYIYQV